MSEQNKSNNGLSVRQMSRLLRRFHVGDGDILALKHNTENANSTAIDIIVKAMERLGIGALVIVVKDFDDLTVLNETEMNKRGWYHLNQMQKLIGGKVTDNKQ